MKFANFPILIPAFTARIYIDTPLPIAADLLNIPFLPSAGTLISEPNYRPALRATFVHGSDFLRRDPDGQMVRLDVTSVARDATGALLRFNYNGVVGMTGDEGKIIRGDVNATTTGFWQRLLGSGRFIVEENEPIVVEYKISEVGAPCGGE
ncbi:hypothetical protein G7Z17_g10694 [Cylindrodendrum hubeiense]|uniref:Uncharacterized protein n=1 Tax=Cylindrodendrum hubeiense TaxID=595255 RepID=A0A9P5L4L1_9HYPO|nr:hypothetical protein G7Z17_g10694 [Cylindrodendrum hubeiense]